eukprot:765553-Hanusia_phi.AAC.1
MGANMAIMKTKGGWARTMETERRGEERRGEERRGEERRGEERRGEERRGEERRGEERRRTSSCSMYKNREREVGHICPGPRDSSRGHFVYVVWLR